MRYMLIKKKEGKIMVEMLDKMRMDSAQKNKRGIAFKREINVFPFRVTRHILQCSGS